MRRGDVEKLLVNETILFAFKHRSLRCAHVHPRGDAELGHGKHDHAHHKSKSRNTSQLGKSASGAKPNSKSRQSLITSASVSTLRLRGPSKKKQGTGDSTANQSKGDFEHSSYGDHDHTVETGSSEMLATVEDEESIDPLAHLIN